MSTLLQEIQEGCTVPNTPLSALLRKALILSKRLLHPPLGEWAQRELEGYPENIELPNYRGRRPCQVLGRFEAGLGSGFVNPIPSANVEEEHRSMLFEFELRKGVAMYEELVQEESLQMPWDQNFVSYYRNSFYTDFALESAWRSVSASVLAQMLDAIRTRLLQFVLEVEEEDPTAGETAVGKTHIQPGRVTQIFNQIFNGDHAVFAASGDTVHQRQTSTENVRRSDGANP
jgi:hypothetical protein